MVVSDAMNGERNGCLVGVLSDTHGLLDQRVLSVFTGVDHIIHAGDVGGPDVLRELAALAPLTAVRGNTDTAAWAWDLPAEAWLELCGRRICVAHDLALLLRHVDVSALDASVVITGHSHRPSVVWRDEVLYLNPGAAGRRRFDFPKAVALLRITDRTLEPRTVILEPGVRPRGR
ncbi:MAG: metallophosphoesterase family protein [Thermoleophilia bacterium]